MTRRRFALLREARVVCVPCFDIYNELALNAFVIRVTLEILVPESFVSTTQNFVVRSTRAERAADIFTGRNLI